MAALSYMQLLESTKSSFKDTISPFHALIASSLGRTEFMDEKIRVYHAIATQQTWSSLKKEKNCPSALSKI
jgi:hypothetical protein